MDIPAFMPDKTERFKEKIKDIPEDVLNSRRYILLDNEEQKEAFTAYLGYRNIKALFELSNSGPQGGNVTWDDCLYNVIHLKTMRNAAIEVLGFAISDFLDNQAFNFHAETVILDDDGSPGIENGIVRAVVFLPSFVSHSVLDWLLLQAEISQYKLCLTNGQHSSWESYLNDVIKKGTLWTSLQRAFQDALARLDFAKGWREVISKMAIFSDK